MATKKTVRIYMAGGAAANIGATLFRQKNAPLTPDEGFADVQLSYIDTSKSNMPAYLKENFYHIEGGVDDELDGSGKVRGSNIKPIRQAVPDILHQHRPADLNIVVHSASGGSGCVIGAALTSELLAQNKDVVVIMIGSKACEKEISNTIDTIHTYQGISNNRKKPVVAIYLENNSQTSMADNDAKTRINALVLAAVWSGQNQGLDSKDLDHFLNYEKVTKFAPSLTGLAIYSTGVKPDLRKGQAVSSMITIVREGEDPTPDIMVGYHSFGTISAGASDAVQIPTPFHLMTIQGYFSEIVAQLQKDLQAAEENYRVNPVHALSLDGVVTEDDGFVL